jgi:two-component system, NtrC family, response regulator GlrR
VLPPLRERREDIAMLVSHFYQELLGDPAAQPAVELVRAMMRCQWKGNVRELASAVERSLVLPPESNMETLDQAPATAAEGSVDLSVPFRAAKTQATTEWEKRYLRHLLVAHEGNISRAARAARMNRSHLSEMVRRLGLVGEDAVDSAEVVEGEVEAD